LSARLPFEAPSAIAVMLQHINERPEPPSKRTTALIPDVLEQLIMRCLAKKRDERPSAQELFSALAATKLADGWSPEIALAWWNDHLSKVMQRS
jgi:serine/threonine-protein kinase